MRLRPVAFAAFALVLAAVPSFAQVPAGPVFLVNEFTTGLRRGPAVAQNAEGRLVVVWTAQGQDGDGFGVFGRIYDGTTGAPGSEFQVNTFTTGNQGQPFDFADVAAGEDGFVVVWSSWAPKPIGIFGQRFDWSGQRLGSEFPVNTVGGGLTMRPQVASNTAGAFTVVWADNYAEAILGRRFDALGSPLGAEFVVRAQIVTDFPDVAVDAAGGFVVVWMGSPYGGGPPPAIFGRRYNAAGNRVGAEFVVSTEPSLGPTFPSVAMSPNGGFMVAWEAQPSGVRGRVYDAAANPLTGDFDVNAATTAQYSRMASVAPYGERNFVVAWHDGGNENVPRRARTYDALGNARGPEFTVADATQYGAAQRPVPRVATDRAGNMTVAWSRVAVDLKYADIEARRLYGGLIPQTPEVDPVAGQSSNGNGILEPCETVAVRPGWRNDTGVSQTVSGTISAFGGPTGPTYSVVDGSADYGAIPDGAAAGCGTDCYSVGLSCADPRPLRHWDATLEEASAPFPQRVSRPLHVGESFTDVPRTSPYYRFVETLLHERITAGCAGRLYCPEAAVTREQVAVFLLLAKEEADFVPNPCHGTSQFADVDPARPTCPYIHGLLRRGITAGCGGGNFCPSGPVTREQMAVFVLRTLDPALDPPACTTPVFADVPATSPYCRWIEELVRRGVVSGCGLGNYCPTAAVTREQMAVYLTVSFGLSLHAP